MTGRAPGAPRPRALFCVIGDAYRSERVAEDVADGRFHIAGRARVLGLPPDWKTASLPADEEWEIEWRKFYYGLDLAHAFGRRGELRFLEAWEALVESFLEGGDPLGDPSDVIGRRVQNWIYAWRRFAEHAAFPGLRAGLAERLLESLDAQTARVRARLTPERNHRTLELYALWIAAAAFPERTGAAERLAFAQAELEENLLADVLIDGVHREASTHYHMTTLRSYLGLRENLRRAGLAASAAFDSRLIRACEFALHAHAPNGSIAALSDADLGDYRELLLLAARLFDRPDFAFAATEGREGAPPALQPGHFPVGGYYFQRSAWERGERFGDARWAVFDCGPLGCGGHGHYDALSVELHADGRALVVDPGRYTYHEGTDSDPNWRAWFKGTAAHNTVCVDGFDQSPYRRGRHRGPRAEARLLARATAPGLDVLAGEVRSPCYGAVHRRTLLFLGEELWLVEDVLEDTEPHEYDLRWHLTPAAEGRAMRTRGPIGWRVRAPGLELALAAEAVPALEAGFVSPRYGEREAAPVVSQRQAGREARFLTLVSPHSVERPSWRLAGHGAHEGVRWVDLVAETADGRLCERVAWADGASRLPISERGVFARAARARFGSAGEPLALVVVPGEASPGPPGEARALALASPPGEGFVA
jgi:hypothetical protein